MAGFGPVDEKRCEHYAAFASHLQRREFDFIYWFLFIFVILMLFLASWQYSGDFEAVQQFESGSREYQKKMKKCMIICSFYSAVSVVAVVMEVYALMALQFCDGEDLMSLYWSTWTMLQVGALIAIFGILLSVFNGLRGNKNPPWALALGTPVLVVAGIGHAVHGAMRKRVHKVRSRSMSHHRGDRRGRGYSISSSMNPVLTSRSAAPTLRERSSSTGDDLPTISREATIRVDDSEREDYSPPEYRAKLVGYTPDGAPIIQFVDEPPAFRPERGSVIGKSDSGQVIVAFRKNMTASMIMTSPPSDMSTRNSIYYTSGGEGGGNANGNAPSYREKPSRSNSLVPPGLLPPNSPPGGGSLLLQPPTTTPGPTTPGGGGGASPNLSLPRPTTPRPAVVRIAEPSDSLPPV